MLATSGKDEILIVTKKGKAIRFPEGDVRSMGRAAAGVIGIRMEDKDRVVEAGCIKNADKASLLVVMENGLGKMSPVTEYRFQGRGGSGVKAAQLTAKTGDIIGAVVLEEGAQGDLLCISKEGQMIRMALSDIPSRGRATQGVIVMRLDPPDKVATMSVVMLDPEAEKAIAEAAAQQREGEVEELFEEAEAVEKAANKTKTKTAKA